MLIRDLISQAGGSVLATMLSCTAAMAQTGGISPREAHEAARVGKSILIDIRPAAERGDTGVAAGAIALPAETAGFEVRLAGIRLDHAGKQIVLIDLTGTQGFALVRTLRGRGWRDLTYLRGGMLGSPGEQGWLKEKLPVESR